MRQNKTKQMLSYWMGLFQEAQSDNTSVRLNWPNRSDVQPAQCRALLGDMFILENDGKDLVYRLAGTKLCGMFGRELKKENFSTPFEGADRRSADDWTGRIGEDDYVVLISSFGLTKTGERINLETLLMPLSHNGVRGGRVLGITCPGDQPYWLGTEAVVEQVIRSVRVLRPWEEDEYLSNWPFKKPGSSAQSDRRANVAAPALYVEPAIDADKTSTIRRVGHLTVLQGGRQN